MLVSKRFFFLYVCRRAGTVMLEVVNLVEKIHQKYTNIKYTEKNRKYQSESVSLTSYWS